MFQVTTLLGAADEVAEAGESAPTAADVEATWKSTIPAGRFADPSEIGSVCAFLASEAAAYVSGVNLPVDGARIAAN